MVRGLLVPIRKLFNLRKKMCGCFLGFLVPRNEEHFQVSLRCMFWGPTSQGSKGGAEGAKFSCVGGSRGVVKGCVQGSAREPWEPGISSCAGFWLTIFSATELKA